MILKIGTMVRVVRIPTAVKKSPNSETREIFQVCLGRVFPILGFQPELLELDVGEVVGKPSYMETIWIEPDCVVKAEEN